MRFTSPALLLLALTLLCCGCARSPIAPAPPRRGLVPLPSTEIAGQLGPFDLPVVMNRPVIREMERFAGPERRGFSVALLRFGEVGLHVRDILDGRDAPRDLVFVAMIESWFDPGAVSPSAAVGPWQFLKATALEYGLRVDRWVDERRDLDRSTHAAATYLCSARRRFEDWPLAIASYNAGVGGVLRALRASRTRDFWSLARSGHLREETRRYVPRVLAAAIITRDPARWGFIPPVLRRTDRDVVEVREPIALSVAARLAGLAEDEVIACNRSLVRGITPPGEASYPLRLPEGAGPRLARALAAGPVERDVWYRSHVVQPRETIHGIARRYRLAPADLLAVNGRISVRNLQPGDRIYLPLPPAGGASVSPSETPEANAAADEAPVSPPDAAARAARRDAGQGARRADPDRPHHPSRDEIETGVAVHTVRGGDSLWRIARRYGTTPERIRELNGLSESRLRIGQRLQVPTPRAADPSQRLVRHTVEAGQSLWSIARRYGVTVTQIRRWNGLAEDDDLLAEQRLWIVQDR